MLKDKVHGAAEDAAAAAALAPVPLPEYADALRRPSIRFGAGSLLDALLKRVRERTQLDVQRADFKLEQLPPHLLMNLRVVDEHGRQLGMGAQPRRAEGRARRRRRARRSRRWRR